MTRYMTKQEQITLELFRKAKQAHNDISNLEYSRELARVHVLEVAKKVKEMYPRELRPSEYSLELLRVA